MAALARRTVVPMPKSVSRVPRIPVQLAPIPWGKPDRALADAVCTHLQHATPPLEIPANPLTDAKLRKLLRSHHVLT